jgi:acyl-CoA thioester hydrolase
MAAWMPAGKFVTRSCDTANMQQFDKEYPLVIQQDLIWGDMDAFGHVNNKVYFRYFEDARMAYFYRIGVHQQNEQVGVAPILAATNCNFRRPLDYPDRIHVAARSHVLSARKIRMEYVVFSEKLGAIAADGEGLVVYYDYGNGKSCEIPQAIVSAIHDLEARR